MIEINELTIGNIDDYDKIISLVKEEYIHPRVIDEFKKRIGLNCDKIIIEYPYNDKDYLSTYYMFYSMKCREYSKKCYRLHFTKNGNYFGYITLRPTVFNTKIGKSYIEPSLLIKNKAYLILDDFKLNLAGSEIATKAFPWMYQETDIAVCAHVAVWSVIRYFGNKYKNYADIRMSDIIKMTPEFIDRKIPCKGLNILQVSEIIRQYGFSPLLMQKNPNSPDEFYSEMIAYIESGIPLIGIMTNKEHAISILGHGTIDYTKLPARSSGVTLVSELIDTIIVNDDNVLPYVELSKKGSANSNSIVNYSIDDIDYVIAPLYDRMQLGYRSVLRRITDLFASGSFSYNSDSVIRVYITSSKSLKRNALNTPNMNNVLKTIILNLNMPKFVWCVDIATPSEYEKRLTSGRIIIDTTCCTWEEQPWMLLHDNNQIFYFDNENWYQNNEKITTYNMYINNLVEV